MVVAIVLFLVLALIGIEKISSLVHGVSHHSARLDGRWLEESVLENNESKNKFVVIDIQGIIMDSVDPWTGLSALDFIRDQLHLAAEDKAVKAVLLRIDSPGGEVLASDEIAREIRRFQTRTKKPVVASMGSLAASGGYYVAAPCRWIVANELTITGSIGVIMQSYNFRGLLNKVGVRPETFKSGRFKDMLSGDREPSEMTDEERAMIQGLIDETYDRFKTVVAEGRQAATDANKGEGRELVSNWRNFADGRVFSGKQAHELGFVDELGNLEVAYERALELGGVRSANLIQYHQPASFANLFRLFGKAQPPEIKLELGVDLPKLQAGKLYFLSSTVLR